MGYEIERKFLITGSKWRSLGEKKKYRQGYLSNCNQQTVRVRTVEDKGYLTIKGKSSGISRKEFEYEIPLQDAVELLKMCQETPIEKYRYIITFENFTWEVDEFLKDNKGLIVAEIELEQEDQLFTKPDWIGEEISHESKYYNAQLAQNPYCTW